MIRSPLALRSLVVFAVSAVFAGGVALAKEEPAGSVVAARGSVAATDAGGATRALAVKSDIFNLDTVRTGKDGRAQLMFRDNTIVSLGVNSVMKVAEYQWSAEQKNGTMKTRVEEGTFRVLGGLITKHSPGNFTTETPAATIGIRGSMYAGKVAGGETIVVFLGGTGIFVVNPFGQVELTQPGYGLHVKTGQAPGQPVLFTFEELTELIDGLAGNASDTGGDGFQVSDRTTDFDKATEDGLPFDPNGFAPPLAGLLGDVVTGYGQRPLLPAPTSQHGTTTLEGTAVGILEGELPASTFSALTGVVIDSSGVGRYLLTGNGGMDEVVINIDRDAGRLDGSFFATDDSDDYGNGDVYVSPQVDSARAYYLNDHAFIGSLDCLDGNCVKWWWGDGYDDLPLSGASNYFVTAPESKQFSEYMTWGYWELGFNADGTEYRLRQPGSLWIAGEKTSENYINNLLDDANYTATYRGPAYGVRIDDAGVTSLTGGATTLHADFANDDLWGKIAFDQHTINFTGNVSSDGSYGGSFQASDDGDAGFDTNVTGAFYGPKANAVGGSFYSSNEGSETVPLEIYQGIFGGNKVGTSPSPVD